MKASKKKERKAGDLKEVKNYNNTHNHGGLYIAGENLTSLEGCPEKMGADSWFNCNSNQLTSLKGCPKENVYQFNCSDNKLTSLEGCPTKVTGSFSCALNQLSSFEHFPKYIGENCNIDKNYFISFKDIDKHIEFIGYALIATGMYITSGYSDLFGIDGLLGIIIDNKEIEKIVNRYLPTKDLIEFQDEMIKAGYESYL